MPQSSARVFRITARRISYIVKATAERAGISPAVSAHWLRHAHASQGIDEGAPITLVSQTLGHADLKTTSVYAHARPNDSSSRCLKNVKPTGLDAWIYVAIDWTPLAPREGLNGASTQSRR